uniref:Uncharacterized protein n=1 Tax=Rhizophora mucronata TaxID=61149 RepID=A0A2P2PPV8_RHIMU
MPQRCDEMLKEHSFALISFNKRIWKMHIGSILFLMRKVQHYGCGCREACGEVGSNNANICFSTF